ncbi:MAG: STAS domain-containing protein [Solirubrobacterales bacterium]|nr:STAS domain-containing protein [Solirubrobacterales bacterium]
MLTLSGELDLANSKALEHELLTARARVRQITVDLRALEFIDSSGLLVLMDAERSCREHDCDLVLRRGGPNIQRLFELTSTLESFCFTD